jgi:hypothetical protein
MLLARPEILNVHMAQASVDSCVLSYHQANCLLVIAVDNPRLLGLKGEVSEQPLERKSLPRNLGKREELCFC